MGTKWDTDERTYVCSYKVILLMEGTEKSDQQMMKFNLASYK